MVVIIESFTRTLEHSNPWTLESFINMFNELTIQQLCALDYGRNMVVTSGPGAGKTRILSHRFCFLLLTGDDVSVPNILTLTFTEKAAEEMKSRIYDMLIKLDRDLGKKGESSFRDKIKRARDQFHNNNISTIHSFCAKLLREHPVESEIDSSFNIIQGLRKNELLDSSINAAILKLWGEDNRVLVPLLRSFGGKPGLFRAVKNLTENSYSFSRVIDTAGRLTSKKEWKKQVFNEYCEKIRDDYVIPYLDGLRESENNKKGFDEILNTLNEWSPLKEDRSKFYGIPDLFGKLRKIAEKRVRSGSKFGITTGLKKLSYVDMVDRYFPDIFINDNPDNLFEEELNYLIRAVQEAVNEYKNEKLKINCLDFSDLETISYGFLKKLHSRDNLTQFKKIQNRYKYIMVDEFQDTNRLQWEIIRMLCLDTGKRGGKSLLPGKVFVVGDKRQAIYRFRGGDVTVFERVNREIIESNSADHVPMFWEDRGKVDNLSCFSFDSAEQEKRFSELSPEIRSNILKGDIYLPHNFRSDTNPITFFNSTFREIFGNKGAEDIKSYETAPRDIYSPDLNNVASNDRGSVTIYRIPKQSNKKDSIEKEASTVAEIIERIMGRRGSESYEYNTFSDIRYKLENRQRAIGVLFFTFLHVKTYENIFRESGIPYIVHKGKGFYRSPEVLEMLQLLNYITDKRQEISLLGVLRSPVFGISDPELFDLFYKRPDAGILNNSNNSYIKKISRQIDTWRFLSARMTISELIRTIVSDRKITAIYSSHPNGYQKIMNMEKLIEIARRFQKDERGSLQEFVRYCLDMADQDEEEGEAVITSGGEAPVSLMTIHAAKGLEFPMVILPQLERKISVRQNPGKTVRLYKSETGDSHAWNSIEGEIPVWPVEIPLIEYKKKYSPLGELLQGRNRLEDIAENRRVFYVGCTRAENHLLLLGQSKRKKDGDNISLTSNDYREHATLFEILDDIYPGKMDFGDNKSRSDNPVIFDMDIETREFTGVDYDNNMPVKDSFGDYDKNLKKLDLTDPLESLPYFQISFSSVRIYQKCPVRFYYHAMLNLRGQQNMEPDGSEEPYERSGVREDENEYSSEDALFIGDLIHKYLEKHDFGKPFDEKLFQKIANSMNGIDCNPGYCLEKGEKQLRNTVDDDQLISMLGSVKNYVEIPFLVTVSPGVEYRGIADRLFRDRETGLWTIIDWKSNDLEGKDPNAIIRENNYDMQLSFYSWAVEKILGERVGRRIIYFLDKGILKEVTWKGDPLKVIEEIVCRMREYEENPEEWKKDFIKEGKDDSECRFCEYRGSVCME